MNLNLKSPSKGVSVSKPEKSKIDLSKYILGSTNIGWLTPLGFKEVVPGDYVNWKINLQAQFAPQLRPNFSRLDFYIHKFFVPNRLCMPKLGTTNSDWDSFIQGDPENIYTTDSCPSTYINTAAIQNDFLEKATVSNYLELPYVDAAETSSQTVMVNILPHLSYALIVDEFYRNEWMQVRRCGQTSNWDINLSGGIMAVGADTTELNTLQKAYYEGDLLMGCTPTAYAGSDSDVELDLDIAATGAQALFARYTGGAVPVIGDATFDGAGNELEDSSGMDLKFYGTGQMLATLEIMELRRAEALTRFLEAENRIGTENIGDWLKSIFGIQNPDFRDAYPRYIGGDKIRVTTQAITNQQDVNEFDSNDPAVAAGHQAGRQYGEGSTGYSDLRVTEYGTIMAIMSCVPRSYYSGSIEKFWTKIGDRMSWYNPYFQNLGDEEVLDMEMGYHLDGSNVGTRGYQTRWYDYKHSQNSIVGNFVDLLQDFHMGYVHDVTAAAPALSNANLKVDWDDDQNIRVFTVQTGTTEHNIWYQVYHDLNIVRPMYLIDIPK